MTDPSKRATCEDCPDSEDDTVRTKVGAPEIKLPTATVHPASDSGYSSRTAATANSTESARISRRKTETRASSDAASNSSRTEKASSRTSRSQTRQREAMAAPQPPPAHPASRSHSRRLSTIVQAPPSQYPPAADPRLTDPRYTDPRYADPRYQYPAGTAPTYGYSYGYGYGVYDRSYYAQPPTPPEPKVKPPTPPQTVPGEWPSDNEARGRTPAAEARRPVARPRPQSYHAGAGGISGWSWPYGYPQDPYTSNPLAIVPPSSSSVPYGPASAIEGAHRTRPPLTQSASENYSARLTSSNATPTIVSYAQRPSPVSAGASAAPSARIMGPSPSERSSSYRSGYGEMTPYRPDSRYSSSYYNSYPQRLRAYSVVPAARLQQTPYEEQRAAEASALMPPPPPPRRASVSGRRRPSLSTNGSSNDTRASVYSNSSGHAVTVEQRSGRRLSYYGHERRDELLAQRELERAALEYQERTRESLAEKEPPQMKAPLPIRERRRSRVAESSYGSNRSEVSSSSRAVQSTVAPDGAVKMRFDVKEGVDVELSGNMDGRTISMRNLADGMTEMTIGTKSPTKSSVRGDNYSTISRTSPTQSRYESRSNSSSNSSSNNNPLPRRTGSRRSQMS